MDEALLAQLTFGSASRTIAGIEFIRMIQKGQVDAFDEPKVNGAKRSVVNLIYLMYNGHY